MTPKKRFDNKLVTASAVISFGIGAFLVFYHAPYRPAICGFEVIFYPFFLTLPLMPIVYPLLYLITYPLRWLTRNGAEDEEDWPEL